MASRLREDHFPLPHAGEGEKKRYAETALGALVHAARVVSLADLL